jgi:pyruvate kinase
MPRKIDIVATIGPASATKEVMEQLILAGAKIFRFPFARERFEVNLERSEQLRQVASRLGEEVLLMQDLPGRKLRIAIEADIPVTAGQVVVIGNAGAPSSPTSEPFLPLNPPGELPPGLKSGTPVYFGDGEVEASVLESPSVGRARCVLLNDGTLQRYRGVTFTDFFGDGDGLTSQDIAVIDQAREFEYDYIALSFVQNPTEIRSVRAHLTQHQKVIAKIETRRGVENISAILDETDAIMIARGDLALQIPYALMPQAERAMLHLARKKNRYSIMATQMIESVESRRVPNRAEIIDIATAVYWGADAVMCSGETRTGSKPVYSIEVMRRIAEQAAIDLESEPR